MLYTNKCASFFVLHVLRMNESAAKNLHNNRVLSDYTKVNSVQPVLDAVSGNWSCSEKGGGTGYDF